MKQRQRQRQRLEAKRPRVNEDGRNSRLRKGSYAISEVWEKWQSEDLGRQEHGRDRKLCNLQDHKRRFLARSDLLCLRSKTTQQRNTKHATRVTQDKTRQDKTRQDRTSAHIYKNKYIYTYAYIYVCYIYISIRPARRTIADNQRNINYWPGGHLQIK